MQGRDGRCAPDRVGVGLGNVTEEIDILGKEVAKLREQAQRALQEASSHDGLLQDLARPWGLRYCLDRSSIQ